MASVRNLNDLGISQFEAYLKRIADGDILDPPRHLLDDPDTSEALLGTAEVVPVELETKYAAATYLSGQLGGLEKNEIDNNVGLWTWLSLFYFDQVCPPSASGLRKPGEFARHILSQHSQKYYRHLLAGPYRLWHLHKDNARVFLHGLLPQHGDFSEQLASRMQVITNCHLIAAVHKLYFDPGAGGIGKPKRGALTRTRPGNLRRLVSVIQQFDRTYDLYAMNTDQILTLLPPEFGSWKA